MNWMPVALVERVPGDQLEIVLHGPGVAVVAVTEGQAEEAPVPGQKAEIDAPGIDPDAGRSLADRGRGVAHGRLHLVEQGVDVPMDVTGQRERVVGKAPDLVDGELRAVERPQNGPAAAGAEIEGQEVRGVFPVRHGNARDPSYMRNADRFQARL